MEELFEDYEKSDISYLTEDVRTLSDDKADMNDYLTGVEIEVGEEETKDSSAGAMSDEDLVHKLFDVAFRTSKLSEPLHIASTRKATYGGEVNTPQYTLSTTRGERNVTGVYKETDEQNDDMMETILKHLDEIAYEQIVELDPHLTEPGKAALLTDVKAPIPQHHLEPQRRGIYDLGTDMSFNLTPKRSQYLQPLYALLGADPQATKLSYMLEEVGRQLDRTCANDDSCLYTTYFFSDLKHVGGGPVAYGRHKELLITEAPQLVTDSAALQHLIETLYRLYEKSPTEDGLCICCLLVTQACNQFDSNSGGRSDWCERPMEANDVFFQRGDLCKMSSVSDSAEDNNIVDELSEIDFFTHQFNINGSNVFQLAKDIDFSNYIVQCVEGIWSVLNQHDECKDCKLTP